MLVLLKSQVWNLEGELQDYVEGEDLEFHVACEDAGLYPHHIPCSSDAHGPRKHSLRDPPSSGPKPTFSDGSSGAGGGLWLPCRVTEGAISSTRSGSTPTSPWQTMARAAPLEGWHFLRDMPVHVEQPIALRGSCFCNMTAHSD